MIRDGNSAGKEVRRGAAGDKWVRDCSSPQTPAPLHRSLIKDSLCPLAAPLSAQGPFRFGSEYLPVLLQVDSAQLSLRDEHKSGFQSPGPLAFPCLWEIKRGTSAWFTPSAFIPLHSPPKTPGDEEQEVEKKRRLATSGLMVTEWLVRSRVVLPFPFGPPPLWSLRNDFHWAYWGVWVEREVKELFPSVCLSELYLTCLTRWMFQQSSPPHQFKWSHYVLLSCSLFAFH